MRKRFPLLLALLSVAAACANPSEEAVDTTDSASGVAATTAPSTNDPRQAIDDAMAKYVEAVKRGDATAAAAAYTDDAIVVMPSGPPMKGRSEVTKGFATMLAASSVKQLRSSNVDRTVSGDVVVETGSFEITLEPKTPGQERTDKGQYIVVWQRQPDGSWRMARAFNRSDPASTS